MTEGLLAGRVVLCTPISGVFIRIFRFVLYCQRCVFFCSETLVSSRCHISEFMIPGFGRPMQLLRSEGDRFRELAVYVRDGFLEYRQQRYECGCCEIIVVKICCLVYSEYTEFNGIKF